MKLCNLILLIIVCLIPVQSAYAQIFQYFDEEGTLIVTDNPYGKKRQLKQQLPDQKTPKREVSLPFRGDVYYEFYETAGNNVHDAMVSTERLGPYDLHERRRYAGQTRWNFGLSYSIRFNYRTEADLILASVEIQDIDFSSDITVLLPELPGALSPEPEAFGIWERFVRELTEHEHDHVRIIRKPDFRQEVLSGIAGIREIILSDSPDESPEVMIKREIEARVAGTAHNVIRRIKEKNDEYDSVTEHGRRPEMRNAFFQGP